ncbi:hypothetical protein R1flu_026754 [Riccia fluitans]|uniref:LOV domain-containing protein n=1 Tax=Riccia fluitans TaxID=41844 RepID=A0ABD1XGW5_9MARC
MPDPCSRSVDILDQLSCAPRRAKREMPTNNARSPFHRRLLSLGTFEKRSTPTAVGNVERPAPVPLTSLPALPRDARGSLEIFGTSATAQKANGTPIFASPAWQIALETAENLLQKGDSPCRTVSSFGDESDTFPTRNGSSDPWKTESRSRVPGIPRPPNPKPKDTISPISVSAGYGGRGNELSPGEECGDVKRALPCSELSVSRPRKMPLTPDKDEPVVAVYVEPDDIEERWRSMLMTTPRALARSIEEASTGDGGDANWQAVLGGGGTVPGHEDNDGVEGSRRRSLGATSAYSDEVRSERAQQWGYEVPLRTSNEYWEGGSTTSRRTSTVSTESRSSGGSSSSQCIPRVAKDVRDAITSFNLAFVVCDATGTDPTYPVLYASGGFFKMFGYEADEVIGNNCRFLQGPRTDPKEIAKIRKALKKGSTYSGKILNYRKDGTSFWNVLSISPIKDNDGKIIKYIGMQAEASDKEKEILVKSKLPEVITEMPKQVPKSKPANLPKPSKPVKTSESASSISQLSLPPPLKDSIDTNTPRSSYRYSLVKSRQSNESLADWHDLARLRADIVSTVMAGEAPQEEVKDESESESEAEKERERREKEKKKEKNAKSVPRAKRVTQLFRKLNNKISERLRTPEIEYVGCEPEDRTQSTADDTDIGRRRRSSFYSNPSVDFRVADPADFAKLDVPERGERLSSSNCAAPAVTHAGRSQFVIIH